MNKIFLFVFALLFGYGSQLTAQTSQWQFIGPSNFPTNISGQINGIGRVCQIKFNPLNPSSIYACSASGGLWKSTDNGNHWFVLGTDVLPKMGTASICIDYTDTNIIYLSSGDPNYYNDDFGIWKSTDGGLNWALSNTGTGNLMAVELLMDSTSHQVLLAATSNGIWRTINAGATWTNVLAGNQFTDMVCKPQTGSSIVYASSLNKFFRSTDFGITWTEITSGLGTYLSAGTRLAVSANNPAVVYIGTIKDEGTILKSVDSGLNFTLQYHDPLHSLTGYDTSGGGQGNYNFCFEASPVDANMLFVGSHCVWRSFDAGLTWSKLTIWSQVLHTDMHDYAFQPSNPSKLFQANDGGVWLTSNEGDDWAHSSDGLGATENYHAAASPLYAGLISTGTQDNGELIFIGNQWKTNRGGDWTTKMQMDYSAQKFVYYFADKERRALPSGSGDPYNVPASITATAIKHAFSPDNQELGYVGGTSIWQTKNLSSATPVWTQITSVTSTVKAMAICEGHPKIFAYSLGSKFYITHNALDPVPVFTNTLFPIASSASDIVISSQDTNLIFVILTNKVYQSTDGGLTFTDYSGTLPNVAQMRIFLDDYSTNKSLYCGNSLGAYYRNATMSDWVNYSGALPSVAGITDFMCFNDGGVDARLYASYFGRGVWETKLENAHTCVTPVISNVVVSGNSAIVNWNAIAGAQYHIQYRLVGEAVWTPMSSTTNSITITNITGCSSYEVRVRTLCTGDYSLWSNKYEFVTPTNTLSNDFDNHQDIGSVGAAGSVCYDAQNQRYTIYASGNDIWDKADQFHYLYKQMSGDVSISARVKHIGNIYGWAKGGVMIRESLNTDSKHSMCVLTPGNGFANQWRTETNDWSSNVDTAGKAPGWVKLERIGNVFTAYFSTDGNTWQVLNSTSIVMNNTVFVGLANCSHIDSTINDAVFDHIVINDIALTVPEVLHEDVPVQIYPNPASDELHVRLVKASNEPMTITLRDVNGKIVMQADAGTNQQYRLDISNLAKGVYVIEIFAGQRYMSKMIKD